MEIGVVVHGPGIIDSGWAIEIINYLANFGNVRCRLGGTMGRTAVIDAALEDVIDISMKLLPSESLEIFNTENVDVIFLLNYGKNQETGQVFGYTAFNHYFKKISNEDYLSTNHKSFYDSKIPVVQIERPGESDSSIISWNVDLNKKIKAKKKGFFSRGGDGEDELSFDFEELFNDVAEKFDLNKSTPEEVLDTYFSDLSEAAARENVEERIAHLPDDDASYTYRRIHGSSPGENILVNGFVIGYSDSDDPILLARDGIIFDIIGGSLKEHGVEKLGPIDLNNAIIKTGLLRKSKEIMPRVLDHNMLGINDIEMNSSASGLKNLDNSFKIAYVDHAAYDIYRFKNFDLVVTIGDDTTLVASDILYRFDIPIIGITDGDLDKVVENGFVNEKSIIIEVAPGFDDIVGHNIFDRLFASNLILEIPFEEDFKDVGEFKRLSFEIFKSHVEGVVKTIVPSFVIKKGSNLEESLVISDFENDNDLEEGFDEDLDEFIDGFDENSPIGGQFVDEAFVSPNEVPGEIYVEHEPVDEIYVEHSVDEVYLDNEPVDEIYVEHEPVDEIYVEHESVDEIYVEHSVDEVYLDGGPVDGEVHEIYVEHEPVEEVHNGQDIVEEVYVEEYPDEQMTSQDLEEDLEDPAYYEDYYEEMDSAEDVIGEEPHEVFIEYESLNETFSEPDSIHDYVEGDTIIEEAVPHEVYIEEPIMEEVVPNEIYTDEQAVPNEIYVEEDFVDDELIDDFYAELPPESLEETYIEPAEFDDGLDYAAGNISDSAVEEKPANDGFDDGIMYEKASFVRSKNDEDEI